MQEGGCRPDHWEGRGERRGEGRGEGEEGIVREHLLCRALSYIEGFW